MFRNGINVSIYTYDLLHLTYMICCMLNFLCVCVCAYEHNGTHLERPDAQVWCKEPVKPGNTTLTDVW